MSDSIFNKEDQGGYMPEVSDYLKAVADSVVKAINAGFGTFGQIYRKAQESDISVQDVENALYWLESEGRIAKHDGGSFDAYLPAEVKPQRIFLTGKGTVGYEVETPKVFEKRGDTPKLPESEPVKELAKAVGSVASITKIPEDASDNDEEPHQQNEVEFFDGGSYAELEAGIKDAVSEKNKFRTILQIKNHLNLPHTFDLSPVIEGMILEHKLRKIEGENFTAYFLYSAGTPWRMWLSGEGTVEAEFSGRGKTDRRPEISDIEPLEIKKIDGSICRLTMDEWINLAKSGVSVRQIADNLQIAYPTFKNNITRASAISEEKAAYREAWHKNRVAPDHWKRNQENTSTVTAAEPVKDVETSEIRDTQVSEITTLFNRLEEKVEESMQQFTETKQKQDEDLAKIRLIQEKLNTFTTYQDNASVLASIRDQVTEMIEDINRNPMTEISVVVDEAVAPNTILGVSPSQPSSWQTIEIDSDAPVIREMAIKKFAFEPIKVEMPETGVVVKTEQLLGSSEVEVKDEMDDQIKPSPFDEPADTNNILNYFADQAYPNGSYERFMERTQPETVEARLEEIFNIVDWMSEKLIETTEAQVNRDTQIMTQISEVARLAARNNLRQDESIKTQFMMDQARVKEAAETSQILQLVTDAKQNQESLEYPMRRLVNRDCEVCAAELQEAVYKRNFSRDVKIVLVTTLVISVIALVSYILSNSFNV